MPNLPVKRTRQDEPRESWHQGVRVFELSSDEGESPKPPKAPKRSKSPKHFKPSLPLLQSKLNAGKAKNFVRGYFNGTTGSQSPAAAAGSSAASETAQRAAKLGSPLTGVGSRKVDVGFQGKVDGKPAIRSNGLLHLSTPRSPVVAHPQEPIKSAKSKNEYRFIGTTAKSMLKTETRGDSEIEILSSTWAPKPPSRSTHAATPKSSRFQSSHPKQQRQPQPQQQQKKQKQKQQEATGTTLAHRPSRALPGVTAATVAATVKKSNTSPGPPPLPPPASPPGRSTKFVLEVALSQDKAPLHLRQEFRSKRKTLFRELKKSTQPAVQRIAEVEEFFGQTGFSASFSTDETAQLRKSASKKLRHVDRSQVALDWGSSSRSSVVNPVGHDVDDDNAALVHPAEQVRQILSARFTDEQHHDEAPITFANDIDNRQLSGKFQFVGEYIINPGVKMTDRRLDIGCSCPGVCRPATCECLAKKITDGRSLQIETYQIPTTTNNPTADNSTTPIITLSDIFLENELDPSSTKFEITECNENCGCYCTASSPARSRCWNRVVERGRTVALEVFLTAHCGFGVRSPQAIRRGQFIELYLGEVITQEELERREEAKDEGASSYVFSLDFFTSSPGQECYHIDGEYFGTAMRFVNHSCNPNAKSFTVVRGQKNDKRIHHVAFFAIRDIPPGEEICIDYHNDGQAVGGGGGSSSDDDDDQKDHIKKEDSKSRSSPGSDGGAKHKQPPLPTLLDPRSLVDDGSGDNGGLVKCQCGAAACRKWLWSPLVRKRKRKLRKFLKNDVQ